MNLVYHKSRYKASYLRDTTLERITKESISNWVRQVTESRDVFFIPVEIDETKVKAGDLIPLSE